MTARRLWIAFAMVVLVHVGQRAQAADALPTVRVVAEQAFVFERPNERSEIVNIAHAGDILTIIDRQDGWYWILQERNQDGSRHPGWVKASDTAIGTAPTYHTAVRTLHEDLTALPPTDSVDFRKLKKEEDEKADQARAQARAEEKALKREAQQASKDARAQARADEAARKAEAKKAAEQARAEEAARQAEARQAAEQARAQARIDEAAKRLEEARRTFDAVSKDPSESTTP